jgi:tRNA A37 methylthiotransferase MiaB
MEESDLILINTCSIREKAEETVRKRLKTFEQVKSGNPGLKVGVLGCMAERLKKKWLEEEKLVDLVVGPDAYRDLPNLIGAAEESNRMRKRSAQPGRNVCRYQSRKARRPMVSPHSFRSCAGATICVLSVSSRSPADASARAIRSVL